MKNILGSKKVGKLVASLSLRTAVKSANQTCATVIHQPVLPAEVKQLKK